ncbi:ZIP family metal transporter [Synechococcus sp. BS55D]|uniref:ZIP family metal transporter n=1 Tax=Synechococcus sp. BS55D TaxID=2055943 RepID=UPI001F29E1C8|nr:ZIP family metal transporter [Synechococcus sp. BS55D]
MSSTATILTGSLGMTLIAMVGAISLILPARRLEVLLLPLVALAAGSLLGGALFHMLPEGFSELMPRQGANWIAAGFSTFLVLEQSLHWHHSHRQRRADSPTAVQPMALLILLGDGLHNLIGGLGITSTYLINPPAGIAAWLAAVLHEIPQELGDFGVLLHSGWRPRQALLWNLISAVTFPLGALIAWAFRTSLPLAPLVLFAAGNFLYIAASDLVPEIKNSQSRLAAASNLGWFLLGLLLLQRLIH